METVTLGRTGITTTRLGYGCSGLLRPSSSAERGALLGAAYDAGIRHFDIARYYGHGGAEAVLGSFLAHDGRRDKVTITTKFGIEPAAIGGGSRGAWIMKLARRLASLHPAAHRLISTAANHAVRAGRFDPESAKRSLETSLREMQTDYVDLLLLHEATLADVGTEGLEEFLARALQDGKIRAWGIGSDFKHVPPLICHAPAFTKVLQFADALGQSNLRSLPPDCGRATLTHSSMKPLSALNRALSRGSNREEFDNWLEASGMDRSTALSKLLLARALRINREGVVLFSSLSTEHIRINAIGPHPAPSDEAWTKFDAIAGRWLRSEEDVAGS